MSTSNRLRRPAERLSGKIRKLREEVRDRGSGTSPRQSLGRTELSVPSPCGSAPLTEDLDACAQYEYRKSPRETFELVGRAIHAGRVRGTPISFDGAAGSPVPVARRAHGVDGRWHKPPERVR